jgi:transposase
VKRPDVSIDRFIRVWQQSPSGKVAAETLGMSLSHASERASRLRRSGIKLKRMPATRRPLNHAKLNALAARHKR